MGAVVQFPPQILLQRNQFLGNYNTEPGLVIIHLFTYLFKFYTPPPISTSDSGQPTDLKT